LNLKDKIEEYVGKSLFRFALVVAVTSVTVVAIFISVCVMFFGATFEVGSFRWGPETTEKSESTIPSATQTTDSRPIADDPVITEAEAQKTTDIESENRLTDVDLPCVLSEDMWKYANRISYKDGREGSGVGFTLPAGNIEVRSPITGYVFEFEHPTPAGESIKMLVITKRSDWSVEMMSAESEIKDKSLFVDVSGWRRVHEDGKVSEGEVILEAEITEAPRMPGIFDKDYNFLFYPSLWWHRSKTETPSDPAEYIRYFISDIGEE
jgi:hypothetical protein